MLKKYEDLEGAVIAAIALKQEEQQVVAGLIDAAEAATENLKTQEKNVKTLLLKLDKAGESITRKTEAVLATIPNEIRQGAQAGAHEAVQNAVADVVGDIKATAAEGRATTRALSRTGILLGVFLLAVAVVVGLIGWAGVGFMIDSRAEELANLKAQVEAEKATLAAIQGETWGMELIKYSDGRRAIALPKGFRLDFEAEMKDEKGKKNGRYGVIIKPF